jgi:hypothetical protein
MATLGYYITCDDAVCKACYQATGGLAEWRARGGFETWERPIPIRSGTEGEADSPTHCWRCEALIPHKLTSDGLEYVCEAYREAAAGRGGRRCIVRAWVLEYLGPAAQVFVIDWPRADRWSPTPEEAPRAQ